MDEDRKLKVILHVGCGRAPLPPSFARNEWREIRYDIDPGVGPDIVGSMTDMAQVADSSVDAILSSHNIEHLPDHDLPRALAEFLRVLRPGGVAWIIVPDVQSLAGRIAAGDLEGELYRSPAGPISVADVLWGHRASLAAGQHYMAHRNGFSATTLERRLVRAGFGPVSVERNASAYELFATATRPASAEELFELAQRAQLERQWAQAEALYAQVLALKPDHWPSWLERGVVCFQLGRKADAVDYVSRSLALEPNFPRTQLALGSFLGMEGKPAEAAAHLQRAIVLDPTLTEAHYNLGKALQEQGDILNAERCYRETLRLEPRHHLARLNLANVLFAQWRAPEALPLYREAAANIADPYVHTNLPMLLNFAPEVSDAEVFAAHEEFHSRQIAGLLASSPPHANTRDPERRLRIGYLSRDFCRHSVRYFLVPLLANHDHGSFEIVCYHFGDRSDEITAFCRRRADRFVDCESMTDEELAERIRHDGIDILVDLAGLTDRNRMHVVGRRPAPIQITYLGYPATTGVRALDYRISDRWIDPEPPEPQIPTSETPLRLAHGYFCYSPIPSSPAVSDLPARRNGYVTFGSLNQAPKLNGPLLERWAEILGELPDARLVIQNQAMQHAPARSRVVEVLEGLGVDGTRLDFRAFAPAPTYLKTYHDVDIALDSFPYNGGTTTCEALWMGVPVVSWCGSRHVARLGASILNNIQLGELVADSAGGYVATAVSLARDPDRLSSLRAGMRRRMSASPLMDHEGFTRELEARYREVWRHWCERRE